MSLQQVPGGPTLQQARRFANPPPGAGVSKKYTTVNGPRASKSNEFPVVPFAPDKYDTLAMIKQSVGDDDNDAFGQKWVVPFTDKDAQYLLRQQAQAQNANYEKWLWQQYDVEDPAQAWIFQQIAPEQFEKRKQLILYQQNLATKYALLRLYGVKSEEDLMLKYLVDTRQIELPKGPVWDPKKWMANQSGLGEVEYAAGGDEANRQWFKRYTAGMWSPLKYVNQKQVGHYPAANRADALGFSNDRVRGQFFVGSDRPNAPYEQYGRGKWAGPAVQFYAPNAHGLGVPPLAIAGPPPPPAIEEELAGGEEED